MTVEYKNMSIFGG